MPQTFVQIRPNWNQMEYSAKWTKKGSDFISFTFNNSDSSYRCYMSNATKFRSDSSKLESNGIQCKEGPRGLKKAQILFIPPLMIKICRFDAT